MKTLKEYERDMDKEYMNDQLKMLEKENDTLIEYKELLDDYFNPECELTDDDLLSRFEEINS